MEFLVGRHGNGGGLSGTSAAGDFEIRPRPRAIHLPFVRSKAGMWRIRLPQDLLLLAGDIGTPSEPEYAAFLADCATLYERVFVVLGNHEAYGSTLLAAADCLRATYRPRRSRGTSASEA